MRPVTPALIVLLAGAALMLAAAIASAKPPRARGGHAVTIVPRTAKAKHGSLVGRATPKPAAPIATAPAQAVPIATAAPVEPATPGPFVPGPGGVAKPSFTVSQTGNTLTLDASASPCHNGGCDFSWRLYRSDGNRLGATMGFGPVLTYTLPAAGVYQIVLTESEYCAPGGGASLRSCPGVAQQTVTAT
jgi:hypothetical protein